MEEKKQIVSDERDVNYGGALFRIGKKYLFGGDRLIWTYYIIFSLFSLIFIFSATNSLVYVEHPDAPFYYIINRVVHLLVGVSAILVVNNINANFYYRLALWIFIASLGLLIVTMLFGDNINSARRSFSSIQPSDFAKLALIIILSKILARYRSIIDDIPLVPINMWMSQLRMKFSNEMSEKKRAITIKKNIRTNYLWKKYSWQFIVPIVLMFAFIVTSNLSTALIISVIGIVVLLIGGIRFSEVFKMGVIALIALAMFLSFYAPSGDVDRTGVWKARMEKFVSGDFHSEQAKTAIALGHIPSGPGSSVQRASLPRAESDFMFAFIVEEYGFVGWSVIIILNIWLFHRTILIAKRHNNPFQAILCVGLGFFICFQSLVHMLVNVGAIPVTGLVLPFLSNGGSAYLSMSITIGIIINISRNQKEVTRETLMAQAKEVKEREEREREEERELELQEIRRVESEAYLLELQSKIEEEKNNDMF